MPAGELRTRRRGDAGKDERAPADVSPVRVREGVRN
jgi:hypothetical protein